MSTSTPLGWLIHGWVGCYQARHEAHFYVLRDDGKYHEAAPGEDGIYTSTVLPGLRVRLDWLWRDPLPTLDEALADLPA